MGKAERMMELAALLNDRKTYRVADLAEYFSVSARTMLRDLQSLSEMGLPLQATPGPHGGYSLIGPSRIPSLPLTAEEAMGLLLSYETFEQYPDGLYVREKKAVAAKVRGLLPPSLLEEVESLRRHVAVDFPVRQYTVSYIGEYLSAARQQAHLRLDYGSASGRRVRRVYPYGVVASDGFWYGVCYCYERKQVVWLRLDRVFFLERDETGRGKENPLPGFTLAQALQHPHSFQGDKMLLQVRLTAKGEKMAEWHPIFGRYVQRTETGGRIDTEISAADIEFFGYFLLGLGKEAVVEEPAAMKKFLGREAEALCRHYGKKTGKL